MKPQKTALVVLTEVERRLDAIRTVDEAKAISDQAEAFRVYAKRAKKGLEVQNHAAFVKIGAERRGGALLRDMAAKGERATRQDGASRRMMLPDTAPTLADLGIDKSQSSRWQVMSTLPEAKVRELVAETTKANQELTSALVYRAARAACVTRTWKGAIPPPTGTYRTIVIDPPWPIEKIEREVRPNQVKPIDYQPMPLEDIRGLAWCGGALPVAEDGAHVYLWVTHRFLPAGLELFAAWGIKYECVLTWVKNVGFTPFSWMYSTEHILFGRVGDLAVARKGLRLDFAAKVREHSRKPNEFYELIQQASPGPRLDMFAREPHDGFTAWGNEAGAFAA